MTGSPGVVDFFAIEAGEYVGRLDALLAAAGGGAPDPEPLVRDARALRGSATMARQMTLAALAGAMEGVALTLRDGRQRWTPQTADAMVAAVDAFKSLLRKVRSWSAADDAVANARVQELRSLVAADSTGVMRGAVVVPVSRLYSSDAGPHVVHRNPRPPITADLRFRQAAVPLASTLRRLIAEARHASDDASRRAAGDDLRAALRDLGELAESYDIGAVTNFARAREAALAQLDERALDTVDSAAQALVEAAGTVWARRTPSAPVAVIEPPAPTAPVEPAAVAVPEPPPTSLPEDLPRAHPPVSGQALVELLETSISGIAGLQHRMADDSDIVAPPEPVAAGADGLVPIDALLYRGRAALGRARELRDTLRTATDRAPDPGLLDELYDLIDLAALDEPARA